MTRNVVREIVKISSHLIINLKNWWVLCHLYL